MNINPIRAAEYCRKLIDKRCNLCELGAVRHKSDEGDYQHKVTFNELNVTARCDESNIWKFLKGETDVIE